MYFPKIKTTSAELTAFCNLRGIDNGNILPIVQLTKPRLTKSLDPETALDNHLQRILDRLGSDQDFIVDVTDDETYQDANLNQYIHDSASGFLSWVQRVRDIQDKHSGQVIPSIVGQANADTLPDLKKQIVTLLKEFPAVSLRVPIQLTDDLSQVQRLLQILGLDNVGNKLFLLFDFDYQKRWTAIADKVSDLDDVLSQLGRNRQNVVLFSSCPENFVITERETGSFNEIEIAEYHAISDITNSENLSFGDYAYIHPRRNEGGGFWLPRIDYPASDNLCHFVRYFNRKTSREPSGRLRVETTVSNENAYRDLCQLVSAQTFCREDNVDSWGRDQIVENCDSEEISGKSPQHYIAIRSNIHMQRVLQIMAES